MFKVQIRTNQSWQVSKKYLSPNVWTSISNTTHASLKEAQVEVSWLTQDFENYGHMLKNFTVDYKIVDDRSEAVWNRSETFNEKAV